MAKTTAQYDQLLPPIADIGSFHVGGVDATLAGLPKRSLTVVPGSPVLDMDQDGDFIAWQTYAQYVKLADPVFPYPVMMWHGGGMTGAVWETKPDGAPGWQRFFLSAGFDVYLSDAVERGRAGWARFPQINKTDPFFISKGEVWRRFRIGPAAGYSSNPSLRRPYPESQFPLASFDNYFRQIVPRWTGNEEQILAGYKALLDRVGPSIIIAHSQGGGLASSVALRHPDLVKALVLIEPGGVGDPVEIANSQAAPVPTLFVWGDRTEEVEFYRNVKKRSIKTAAAIRARGVTSELLDLPALGHFGNTHMIMMDANSDAVAELVRVWIAKQIQSET